VTRPLTSGAPLPATIRARLRSTFRRDLIGPGPNDVDLATELLSERPGRWYLTGYLVPAPDTVLDPSEADPSLELGDPAETGDPLPGGARSEDEGDPDPAPARRILQPSSLGLTVQVPVMVRHLTVTLTWGDYTTEPPMPVLELEATGLRATNPNWRRHPRSATLSAEIPANGRGRPITVPDSAAIGHRVGALQLELLARPYDIRQPDGSIAPTRVVTVMLVNRRSPLKNRAADLTAAFQVCLSISCEEGLVARADLSSLKDAEFDRRLADLQYRDVVEYAVGLNTSADWPEGDRVTTAWTEPLPMAEVLRVAPNQAIGGVTWGMEDLAGAAASAEALRAALAALPDAYAAWIDGQEAGIGGIDGASRQATAHDLIARMRQVKDRISAGIALLAADARARRAFAAMNEAVARAARRRNAGPGGDPASVKAPAWRPFQLAFILMNLPGLTQKTHPDRETVDLLFFPTGGGKTEAYLGLAAYAIAHRRLSSGGALGAGVTVLMRYTLRLLTLDQLSRAAGVICALELMRGEAAWQEKGKPLLGDWPIEIGLWVGSSASPNKLGKKGNSDDSTAVVRVRRFKQTGNEAPAPIKACPWCGTPFDRQSFACVPSDVAPKNMEIRCANIECEFTGDRALPVLTVDEAIYRRLPAFLIATVDKFAGLPWLGEAGAFFGHVDRMDAFGFYGANDGANEGKRLWNGARLDPPDLIVQDELHLISGPLGTVAGLYETALDRLCLRTEEGFAVRPKIVASTATVRRAEKQIEALFGRKETQVFPPPGPDRNDSFFAVTEAPEVSPSRWYIGLAAQGKGPKLIFLRALTTLLAASMAEHGTAGEAADPYMTAVCYFNALRELGGARRIVEDEVRTRLREYGAKRRRLDPPDAPFADRRLPQETGILELTSRVSTDKVAEAKALLEKPCNGVNSGVDVALATNMISVGLDITRLGLMLVQGQPKTAAEYIQATSRVGRDPNKPGLVLAVLNVHKPRDRMHYERFRQFHACFYRVVEATSVTPWAARALDRALAAVVVSLARHLLPDMTPQTAVARLKQHPELRREVKQVIVSRAPPGAVAGGTAALEQAIDQLMDGWLDVADEQTRTSGAFAYGQATHALLHDPLDPVLKNLAPAHQAFKAAWSMRDVEATVPLDIRQPNGAVLSVPQGSR
jgi:hypothetical protein